MNERKTKGLTNLNSDEKIIRDTCVSLARMYFSQFVAISCLAIFVEIYRVGDNTRTVNMSTGPQISEQLGTESAC